MSGYTNQYDASKNYTLHRFHDEERGVQSTELNELQSREQLKIKKLSEIIGQGFVRSGGFNNIVNGTGVVTLDAAEVFVDGHYLSVAAGTVTIPDGLAVKVGVRVVDSVITSVEDASLLNPVVDTDGYDKPGADREKKTLSWGWEASDASDDGGSGTLYPLIFFYDRRYLAQRTSFNPPRALINHDDFSGMTIFDDILYDFDLGNVNVTTDITVKLDNDTFYNYAESGTKYFSDFAATAGEANRIVKIERLDAGIRFNGRDIDIDFDTAKASFFIKRETDIDWFVTGINYGN